MRLTQSKNALGQLTNGSIYTSVVMQDTSSADKLVMQVDVDESLNAPFPNMSFYVNGAVPESDTIDQMIQGQGKK